MGKSSPIQGALRRAFPLIRTQNSRSTPHVNNHVEVDGLGAWTGKQGRGVLADPPATSGRPTASDADGLKSYWVRRGPPVFVDWSGIPWLHHRKGSDHVPVTAFRVVAGLSDGISRWQAFDAPPFGRNVLVASHDEDFGVGYHCK